MKEYRVSLIDKAGNKQMDHISASTAQAAADYIRQDWPGCYIVWIAETVRDWQ